MNTLFNIRLEQSIHFIIFSHFVLIYGFAWTGIVLMVYFFSFIFIFIFLFLFISLVSEIVVFRLLQLLLFNRTLSIIIIFAFCNIKPYFVFILFIKWELILRLNQLLLFHCLGLTISFVLIFWDHELNLLILDDSVIAFFTSSFTIFTISLTINVVIFYLIIDLQLVVVLILSVI